ncbi:MAG: TonB family protein [Polyangiales bacterium]
MPGPDRTRWLIASVGAHLALFGLLLALPKRPSRSAFVQRVLASEFSIEQTSAPEVVTERRVLPPTPAASAPPRITPRSAPPSRTIAPPAQRPAPAAPPVEAPPAPEVPPAPPPVEAPRLRATDLLRASPSSMSFPLDVTQSGDAPARRALFAGSAGSELDRARAASQGYVREVLAESTVREAPGVRAYLWNVRRRVSEVWRPGVVRVPNLGETLLSGLLAPERAMRILGERVMRRQRQILEAPRERLGGAVDAIEAIGGVAGNGPTARMGLPTDTGEESWRRNSRTTRVEVQVDQDPNGRVLDVRIVRSSGMAAFDRAALAAVREGVDAQDPVALPGGRSSRWSFTVVATRRLFAPTIGGSFDESRGWFQVQLPGQVSIRSRVQMESSAPLENAPRT